uniref:Ig-like domain-containing protein n=1 Tax=Timema monikensis TaxID=170555 RepID=A0A7R9E420_9NEOP|nr:unnamed protein product [Timema monikensis]
MLVQHLQLPRHFGVPEGGTWRWWYREIAGSMQEVRGGSVLVRPLQSVLQFPRVLPEDAARYVCVVSSLLGEDRREVTLTVSTALAVHLRPQQQVIGVVLYLVLAPHLWRTRSDHETDPRVFSHPQKVDAGAATTFNCSVVGGGVTGTHLAWLKNGRPLTEGARVSVLAGGEVLLVRAVRKEDRGMYQCFARSGEESAQSSGELTLGAVAPELQSTFIEQTLQPGPPVSLRCAASGNPPPRFTWLLDGVVVHPPEYVLGSFLDSAGDVVSHLNISSARVPHGGLYTCIARNMLGAVQHSATLNIYGPPSARLPQNLTVVAGTDVFLRCPVAGFPISSVTWQRAGDILPSHLRQRVFPNGTLLVRQVDCSSDRGEYLCSATNQQGQSAQGRIYLDVMKPPEIAPFQFPSNLQEGMRAQVSCSIISGDFPISITWRKDAGPLPQDADVHEQQHQFVSNLLFGNLAARHSGHYTCIASNAAAVANFTARLVVMGIRFIVRASGSSSGVSCVANYSTRFIVRAPGSSSGVSCVANYSTSILFRGELCGQLQHQVHCQGPSFLDGRTSGPLRPVPTSGDAPLSGQRLPYADNHLDES